MAVQTGPAASGHPDARSSWLTAVNLAHALRREGAGARTSDEKRSIGATDTALYRLHRHPSASSPTGPAAHRHRSHSRQARDVGVNAARVRKYLAALVKP